MTFQKGHPQVGHREKDKKTRNKPYATVQKWAKKMMQHGYVGEKNIGNSHTWCKCGRQFDSEKGLAVHIGRMRKLSNMVAEYLPSNPNQGSY